MVGYWQFLDLPRASVFDHWGAIIIIAIGTVMISFWIADRFKHR